MARKSRKESAKAVAAFVPAAGILNVWQALYMDSRNRNIRRKKGSGRLF